MKKDRPSARNEAKKDRPTEPPHDAAIEHPGGTAAGAVAGAAAAGAAVGSVAGPVGTAVGAAAGTLAGAWAGREIAERIDERAEHDYWRENYASRPYVRKGAPFDDYGPAYRYGVQMYREHGSRMFEHAEPDLASGWSDARGTSRLEWADARLAAHDAWQRVHSTVERELPVNLARARDEPPPEDRG